MELKPCPFCGELPDSYPWITLGAKPGEWRISCSKSMSCLASFCVKESQEEAVKFWNTRKGGKL